MAYQWVPIAPKNWQILQLTFERNFIDELLKNKEEEEAKKHSNNLRLIDDILTWGAEPPSPEICMLKWSKTTIEHGYVVYLGANIKNMNG